MENNAQVTTKSVQDNFKTLINPSDDVLDALEAYVIPGDAEPEQPVIKDATSEKEETTNITEKQVSEPGVLDADEISALTDDGDDAVEPVKNTDKGGIKSTDTMPVSKSKQLDILSDFLTPEQKQELIGLGDKDEIEKRTLELLRENIENTKKETLLSFYESLPEEAQLLIQYALNDGTNIREFIKSLYEDNPVSEIDRMSNEMVVRNYLKFKNFSEEDIQEQLDLFKQSGALDKKAQKYREELKKQAEFKTREKIKTQEEIKKKKEEYSKWYVEELNMVIEDFPKDIQKDIVKGLVQSDMKSISGHPINELYYLLEKYQIREPNLKLVGEALWLLKDPENYKNSIREKYKNEIIDTELKKHLKKSTDKVTNKANTYVDDTTTRSSDRGSYIPSRNKNTNAFKNILFGRA